MKIQLKRSNQLDGGSAKAPSIGYMEYGELAVNFNEADPCIFIKASDGAGTDSIVRIAGAGAESGGLPNGGTDERPDTPSVGDLFFDTDLNLIVYWDGNQWVPVSPGVITSDSKPTESLYAAGTLWYNSDEAEGALYILYEDPAGPGANAGGKVWVQIAGGSGGSGGSVIVADNPPNAADEGDLWFDSDSGRLYIWYVNANSQGQWVDASPDGGGDADGSDFVSKVDTASQNIVSDLTLGTDKITLDATDGRATFAGGIDTVSTSTDGMQVDSTGGIGVQRSDGEGLAFTVLNQTTNTVNIKANGSAEFAEQKVNIYSDGVLRVGSNPGTDGEYGADLNPNGQVRIRTSDAEAVRIYTSTGTDESITLNSDGTAIFQGNVHAKYNASHPNEASLNISGANGAKFIQLYDRVNLKNNSFSYDNGFLLYDGSATFNSTVRGDGGFLVYPPSDDTYSFATRNAADDKWSAYITGEGSAKFASFVESTNGSGQCALFPDGTAAISEGIYLQDTDPVRFLSANGPHGSGSGNLYFGNSQIQTTTFYEIWLEPDNDANYTTTTEEYTETESYTGPLGNTLEREVTKTRDVSTYTGPTLDVKDRLQNLIARLDALEADEISDDAASNALLTLIASLTARVDARDAVIAELTTRIQTLEGGNN